MDKFKDIKIQPKNVDEYIELLPEKLRKNFERLRTIIKKAAPEAEEIMSYQMPALKYQGMVIWFATFKKHYTLFIPPETLSLFKNELTDYDLTKSAIRIPFEKQISAKLITKIITHRIQTNIIKAQLKKNK